MKALQITHVPGSSYVVNGISKRDFPRFAETHNIVSGGNGTYRVKEPAVTTLAYEDDNGKVGYMEFGQETREIINRKNIHQSKINTLNLAIGGMNIGSLMREDLKSTFKKVFDAEEKRQKELKKQMNDTGKISDILKK